MVTYLLVIVSSFITTMYDYAGITILAKHRNSATSLLYPKGYILSAVWYACSPERLHSIPRAHKFVFLC